MLKTVYIESNYHSGNLYNTLFGELFEGKCFKFSMTVSMVFLR